MQNIKKKLHDAYDNFQDRLTQPENTTKTEYKNLSDLLKEFWELANLTELEEHTTNKVMIYSSYVPIPKKNTEKQEEVLSTDSEIINSFYIEDLQYISKKCQSKKEDIGSPLRVHRRCLDPMFSVANEIAYDNLMIQATQNKKSTIEQVFPVSQWINVKDGYFHHHWSEDEGQAVLEILVKITQKTRNLPSLYIISPFKDVAYCMKQYLKNNLNVRGLTKPEITEWINNSVGTIHTFQGKQAEAVILLLGGNPTKPESMQWAASYPNLLNVAITRAQNLLFVVILGDKICQC